MAESGLGEGRARSWFFCSSTAPACQPIGRPGSKSGKDEWNGEASMILTLPRVIYG